MRDRPDPDERIRLPGVLAALRDTKSLISRSVASLSPEDPGYFGGGSVSWRVFSHASYGISGIAAVLVQALHPTAMAAVDAHSAFRTDAWRRAHMTADYVFTITFSARSVAKAAATRVRRIHQAIVGVDPATGLTHRADEPELLLWVHAVHTEYALRGYESFAGHLSDEDADRFVAEQVAAAELVGLAPELVPKTRAELQAWIAAVPDLAVTEPARRFRDLLLGAAMPLPMRPFWALHILGAAALLPFDIRRAYALPRWLPHGPLTRLAIAFAIGAVNSGYLLFRPVRQARRRMREVARAALARSAARKR